MLLEWENNSEKLQIISGKFQNNVVKDVKQISLSHVIRELTLPFFLCKYIHVKVKWMKICLLTFKNNDMMSDVTSYFFTSAKFKWFLLHQY